MPIEISGQPSPCAANTSEGAAVQVGRNEPTSGQRETGRPSALDTVTLTEGAAMLQKLDAAIVKVPVVDIQRVASMQRSLADGGYQPDPVQVADKLMTFEAALYGRGRS